MTDSEKIKELEDDIGGLQLELLLVSAVRNTAHRNLMKAQSEMEVQRAKIESLESEIRYLRKYIKSLEGK